MPFTREKAPLEKLFAGEKLDAGAQPHAGWRQHRLSTPSPSSNALHPDSDPQAALERYGAASSLNTVRIEMESSETENRIVEDIHTANGDARWNQRRCRFRRNDWIRQATVRRTADPQRRLDRAIYFEAGSLG